MNKKINFEQLEQWFNTYNKYKQEKRKKQILTLIILTCENYVKTLSYGLARRTNDPIEDIIQVANIGLIKAVKKYKPTYNNLKAYISYTIIGEIKHYLRDKTTLIKPPREIIELSYRINKLSVEEIEKAGKKYYQEKLAENLNTTTEKVREAYEIDRRKTLSLDQIQFKEYNNDYSDLYNISSLEDNVYKLKEYKTILEEAIKRLPNKSKYVIEKIYFENISQIELAKQLKTSQSNISRIQKKALKLLFEIITNDTSTKKEKE